LVTIEDIHVKFHRQIEYRRQYQNCKITSNGVVNGSRDLLLKFWDPYLVTSVITSCKSESVVAGISVRAPRYISHYQL